MFIPSQIHSYTGKYLAICHKIRSSFVKFYDVGGAVDDVMVFTFLQPRGFVDTLATWSLWSAEGNQQYQKWWGGLRYDTTKAKGMLHLLEGGVTSRFINSI